MAELSPDAQAIVDRLKREGDLSRNSGTNSIRSVKIELNKFQDIFKTISSNISAQNDILKLNTGLAKEAAKNAEEEAERSKSEDQFEKLEPQTKYEKDDDNQKTKLVSDEENKKINSMGDAIASALSFKNLALAGAGLFVGYNFLKGFIDEKTGGGFTEFEKNIGPFAKSLPGIGSALSDFPGTLARLQTSIDGIGKSITDFSSSINSFLKDYGTPLAMLGGLIGLLGFGGLGGLASLVAAVINAMNRGPKVPVPTTASPTVGQKPGAPSPGTSGNPATSTPGTPGKQSTNTQSAPEQTKVKRTSRGSTVRIAQPTGAAASQANSSATSREKTISDPKMSKVYFKLVKGLGAIGIFLTAYEATQLMGLIDNPNSTQKEKQVQVAGFLGEMIGAVAGGTAGAIIGAFGGPWGALILGVIGAGLGALGGGLIAEYIAKWAFEEGAPSQEDIDKKNRQIGIDQYLDKVDARPEKPLNRGTKGFGEQAKAYADWNAQYGETHNPDGTPKASVSTGSTGGGRGSVVEKPGERAAYMQARADREAASLEELDRIPSSVITDTPESMVTGSTNRRNALNAVAGNSGGGSAVIINAPVSAPSSINLTNGGSSVNQLSISGGGGAGLGPSMLPYGLTNAYN
jgi:hypothetical protein